MCVGSGRVMHLVVENCWLCEVFGLCGAAFPLSFYSIFFDFLRHYPLTSFTIDPHLLSLILYFPSFDPCLAFSQLPLTGYHVAPKRRQNFYQRQLFQFVPHSLQLLSFRNLSIQPHYFYRWIFKVFLFPSKTEILNAWSGIKQFIACLKTRLLKYH